jgi:hypothetical protein
LQSPTTAGGCIDADRLSALEVTTVHELVDPGIEMSTEWLPSLVLNYVKSRRAGLEQFFSEDIRDQPERRRRSGVYGVIIDFAGSHLACQLWNPQGVKSRRVSR